MDVTFVCTGNTCRSVLAEGFMKVMAPEFNVSSCGTAASSLYKVPEIVLKLLKKEGIDLSGHVSMQVDAGMLEKTDYVFVMENVHLLYLINKYPPAKNKTFLLKEFAGAGGSPEIPDPIGRPEEVYEQTASEIKCCIVLVYEKLKKGT